MSFVWPVSCLWDVVCELWFIAVIGCGPGHVGCGMQAGRYFVVGGSEFPLHQQIHIVFVHLVNPTALSICTIPAMDADLSALMFGEYGVSQVVSGMLY